MHVEHVLSSIMNRVAAQIRDPDEEKSDFVFWFFLVAGFNFFTLKTKLVPCLEAILVPKMEPCLVPPLTKPYVENQFWFHFWNQFWFQKRNHLIFQCLLPNCFNCLSKKRLQTVFPSGPCFWFQGVRTMVGEAVNQCPNSTSSWNSVTNLCILVFSPVHWMMQTCKHYQTIVHICCKAILAQHEHIADIFW